jgi:sulfate adenylyltransferase (ADP) / ATP adenylyltransferase
MAFQRGMLWHEVVRVTEQALCSGVLYPLSTEYEFIEDCGVRFFVRVLSGLQRKDAARQLQRSEATSSGSEVNPFLPYEKDLFVAEISGTHVAVLNKFNVVEHHLLIITRDFEDQETLLTPADFQAFWSCMGEYPCLGFYNAGEVAGASQRHKHLQIVPLPLAPEGPMVPIESLFEKLTFENFLGIVPGLPFLHVFALTGYSLAKPDADMTAKTFQLYSAMLRKAGMSSPASIGQRQSGPYALLITQDWMLLIPRSREFFGPISVNSLGFAGALLVKNEEQMKMVKGCGPMAVLREVALPLQEKHI